MKGAGIVVLLSLAAAACGRVGGESSGQDTQSTDGAADSVIDAASDSGAGSDTGIDGLPPGCPATIPAATPPMECDKSLVGTECTYHCDLHGSEKYKCLTSGDFPYPIWYETQGCFDPSPDAY